MRNETNEIIYIYTVDPTDHSETIALQVPPGMSQELHGGCDGPLVARDADGSLLSRRGQLNKCNMDDWVVGR